MVVVVIVVIVMAVHISGMEGDIHTQHDDDNHVCDIIYIYI